MNWLIALLLPLYTGITSRQSGGGYGAQHLPSWLTWLPEVFFALPFGLAPALVLYPSIGLYAIAVGLCGTAWSYIWMQSATGPALPWGDNPAASMSRPRTLSPVVNWISDRLGFTRGDKNYCRTWMAVKGFLIGLPVGGILLMILWPLGYEIGHRFRNHTISETAAGIGAGLSVLAFLVVL